MAPGWYRTSRTWTRQHAVEKHYHLYANADTEGRATWDSRNTGAAMCFLNDVEMQYIADKLFIGNQLSTAQLLTSDGVRIDLRNIRSPILVFCSYGDDITPPAQALGWITDLYRDDRDLLSHDQTIVYATHDSIGHLGIFVSSAVGGKEHRKFASAIEQIELLPAGIFHATVKDAPPAPLLQDPHLLAIRRSGIDEVRAIVQPDAVSERRFAAAARVSEINLALYRSLLQPCVRAWATPPVAQALQALAPDARQLRALVQRAPAGALRAGPGRAGARAARGGGAGQPLPAVAGAGLAGDRAFAGRPPRSATKAGASPSRRCTARRGCSRSSAATPPAPCAHTPANHPSTAPSSSRSRPICNSNCTWAVCRRPHCARCSTSSATAGDGRAPASRGRAAAA